MKHLVKFQLQNSESVYVEAEEIAVGQHPAARGGSIEEATVCFNEALNKVKPAAEAALNAFRELNTPDEISLEFGIKLSGSVGAILASVESEAIFKVVLKWNNSD
jgi:hypothetical protein